MKHIKTFSLFEARKTLTKVQVEFLDRYVQETWKYDPETGLVDIEGVFYLHDKRAKSFRGIRFGQVSGSFNCSVNELTSLEGAPKKVEGDFECYHNQLKSLKGGPQIVGGDFNCSHNRLTSLEGAPQTVGGHFRCYDNNLTSLEGAPQTVDKSFYCFYSKLTSLEGAPQTVGGHFQCSDNNLTSLEGAPQTVGQDFVCVNNPLKSLKGAPRAVGGKFECDAFQLDPGEWNPVGWLKAAQKNYQAAKLLVPLLTEPQLDVWMRKNPLDLDLLDDFPEIKAGVLKRTGLRDISKLSASLRQKLL